MMRKLGIALVVVLIVAAGVIAYALATLNSTLESNRDEIRAQITSAVARDVAFEEISASFSSGIGARVRGLRVGDDPEFSDEDFLSAEEVFVSVRLLPLLWKRIEVAQIALEKPTIRIIRTKDGMNLDSIGVAESTGDPAGASPPSSGGSPADQGDTEGEGDTPAGDGASPIALLVSLIDIRGASVRYLDRSEDPPTDLRIDGLDLEASDVSLTEPIGIRLSAALFGAGRENVVLEGSIGPIGDPPNPGAVALALEGRLGPIDVAALRRALPNAVPVELEAPDPIVFTASVRGDPKRVELTFAFDLTDGSIGWGEVFHKPDGVPFGIDLRASADLPSEESSALAVSIEELRFRLASLDLQGKGTVRRASPTSIDLKLDSNRASLDGWDRILPGLAGNDVSGGLEVHLSARGTLDAGTVPSLEGTIALSDVTARADGSPYEIEGLTTTISLRGDALQLPKTTFRLGGSPIEVEADVQNLPKARATFALRSPELRAASLGVAAPEARNEEILRGLDVSGALDLTGENPAFDGTVKTAGGMLRDVPHDDLLAELRLRDQVATLRRLELHAFDGRYEGSGQYVMKNPDDPSFDFRSTIRGMRVEKLLGSQFPGAENRMEGALDADLELAGSGAGWDRVQKTLTGDGRVAVLDGILRDVNLAEGVLSGATGVAGLSSFISPRIRKKYPEIFSTGDTKFEKLGGTVVIADARATTEDLEIAARDYAVRGKGWYGFDSQVDLTATFVGSKKLTDDLIDEVKEVKYLSNDQGKLELPFRLAGRIPGAKPKPDSRFIATALQRAVTEKVVEKGIDKLLGKKKKGNEVELEGEGSKRPEEELLRKGLEGLFGR